MMYKLTLSILLAGVLISQHCRSQAYINYANGKPVKLSWHDSKPSKLTDGKLSSGSTWHNPKGQAKTIDIDLTAEFEIGGVHVFTRNRGILPLREFEFEYYSDGNWIAIAGSKVEDNFKRHIVVKFTESISTAVIRMIARAESTFGLEEIQVWGREVPQNITDLTLKEEKPFVADKHWICVNQVAYNSQAYKAFTVPTAKSNLPFTVHEKQTRNVVYRGNLINQKGVFSNFKPKENNQEYYIRIEGDGFVAEESYPFMIGNQAIQEMAYKPAVDFLNDARSMVGSHPSAYGGTAWRDGTYYTYEVPAMVIFYLSNPEVFNQMPVTMDWSKEKELVFSSDYSPTDEPNDDDALSTVQGYYTRLPSPRTKDVPDIIQCIRFGIGWNLLDPKSADPSGDPLGELLHSQTIEMFSYFLYGYPAYEQYIDEALYKMVLDSSLVWWEESGLFDVITKTGNPKGRHCPGHSIMPNLLMYEIAKREKLPNPERFMQAAINQTEWIIKNADWDNPAFTKGQRISEHKLVTGLAHFQMNYRKFAPDGLKRKLESWAEKVVSLSDNLWDYRRLDDTDWTIPAYSEVGNVIGFPACALSVALTLKKGKLRSRLVELAYAHFDNFNGRNPANSHCAAHHKLGFEGIEKGWPHEDKRRDICARLEITRGSLSSLPGSEMYPFNPNGKPRHPEGWTVYNANWDLSLAYLNFYEGISSAKILRKLQ